MPAEEKPVDELTKLALPGLERVLVRPYVDELLTAWALALPVWNMGRTREWYTF